MKVATTAGVLLTGVGLVHLSAKIAANRIRSNPDPYPYEQLCEEPIGETVVIRCHDGTEIRAKAQGAGPTVVLTHGYGQSLREWNVLWTLLRRAGYRVIAFDQRGHGLSTIGTDGMSSAAMAADYKAVLEHFDVHDAILVGHSMGAFLSIVFLLTYPDLTADRVRGVVLIGGLAGDSLKGAPRTGCRFRCSKQAYSTGPPAPTLTDCSSVPHSADQSPHQLLFALACRKRPLRDIGKSRPSWLPKHGRIIITDSGRSLYPARWFAAERTEPLRPALHRTGKRIPQARNIWIDGKGHLLNWEAPDLLRDTIQSFWSSTRDFATSTSPPILDAGCTTPAESCSRSLPLTSLPVGVRGSSSAKWNSRGTLKCAMRSRAYVDELGRAGRRRFDAGGGLHERRRPAPPSPRRAPRSRRCRAPSGAG